MHLSLLFFVKKSESQNTCDELQVHVPYPIGMDP